jgi:hypothetical protein
LKQRLISTFLWPTLNGLASSVQQNKAASSERRPQPNLGFGDQQKTLRLTGRIKLRSLFVAKFIESRISLQE